MKTVKLLIACTGYDTAILLDGKMLGPGIKKMELRAEGGEASLDITGINVAHFRFGSAEEFQTFCEKAEG